MGRFYLWKRRVRVRNFKGVDDAMVWVVALALTKRCAKGNSGSVSLSQEYKWTPPKLPWKPGKMREPNPTMNWHPNIAIYLGGMSSEGKEQILLTVASHALDAFARVGDGKNYAKLFSIKRVIKALAWCCCSAKAKYTPFTLHERVRPAMTEIMYIGWVLRKVSSLNPV